MKKSGRKIENYDMTLSVADNEKNIKAKYDRINSATGVAKHVVNKVIGREETIDSLLVIDPNPICTTQWEQVEVYKAWDGNWYIKGTPVPECPKDTYGDKCHIKCDPVVGCTRTDTPEQIIIKKKAHRKKKCDEQLDASYCEYNEYNPSGIRTTKFQERTKIFNNQFTTHKKNVDERNIAHKSRMFGLESEITKEEDYKLKLANDYIVELGELDRRIETITKEIDSTNSQISVLTKQLIEQRVANVILNDNKTIAEIISNAKSIDDDNKKLESEIAILNQKVERSKMIRDTLQNQYNILKGVPTKTAITQASAKTPVANNKLPAPPATKPTPTSGAPKATAATSKNSFCPIL